MNNPVFLCCDVLSLLHYPVFYSKRSNYLFHESDVVTQLQDKNSIHFPINVDTEFQTPDVSRLEPLEEKILTVQVRPIKMPLAETHVFAHPDIKAIARHPLMTTDFAPIDTLRKLGFQVDLLSSHSLTELKAEERRLSDIPFFEFALYGHFLVADYLNIAAGRFKQELLKLTRKNGSSDRIENGRRLRTVSGESNYQSDWIEVSGWYLKLEGRLYRIRLAFFDSCAVHGNCSLKQLAQNVNYQLPYKDELNADDKAQMGLIYQTKPEAFDRYAQGDCVVYDILNANASKFEIVYSNLGLGSEYQIPKLTIGSTMRHLIDITLQKFIEPDFNKFQQKYGEQGLKAIAKYFGAKTLRDVDQLIEYLTQGANAQRLKLMLATTAAYNAKVDGGLCKNFKPNAVHAAGVLGDIDISGAYGEGLRNQEYPIGIPYIIDFPIGNGHNDRPTLRQFFREYATELVPGCWQLRVSTEVELKIGQDFILSWITPAKLNNLSTDTELIEADLEASEIKDWLEKNNGTTKLLTHEIKNGIITHDLWQLIANVASPQQRNELLDEVKVDTGVIYLATHRVDTVCELLERLAAHTGQNTTRLAGKKGHRVKKSKEDAGYYWCSVNLGNLLVTQLLVERKKYKKKGQTGATSESIALNTLFKLCINTVYGDLVSPLFNIGNVVAGNNITARCRVLAWVMGKGLNCHQIITDGGIFDLNRVLNPKKDRRVTAEAVINLSLLTDEQVNHRHLQYKPLRDFDPVTLMPIGEPQRIELSWEVLDEGKTIPVLRAYGKIYKGDEAKEWVNQAAMAHLRELFPTLDVLHQSSTAIRLSHNDDGSHSVSYVAQCGQFCFELKEFYDEAVFHGSANYACWQNKQLVLTKFRSYETSKPHYGYRQVALTETDKLELTETYKESNPPIEFSQSIRANPRAVQRLEPYIKRAILKPSEYRLRYEDKYQHSSLVPGKTYPKAGQFREFSLSQFTFRTYKQLNSWERVVEKLKKKFGQSLEIFYLNPDGTLNYARLAHDIAWQIALGRNQPDGYGGKNDSRHYQEHPHHPTFERLKRAAMATYMPQESQEA